MTESNVGTLNHLKFFEDQYRRVEHLRHRRRAIAAVVALTMFGLLVYLASPAAVWAFVLLIYAVAFIGLHKLDGALRVTAAALADLRDIARALNHDPPPSREEITKFVRGRITPDDSNVPEALWALCSGHASSEGVRAAANSAFSQPSSELSVAQFMRTVLVLGGLFGTVLFFAVELGSTGILTGDLTSLLPGLKGALASTLTGILGSAAVGYMASLIDQVVERSVWETESLIAGPFAQALAVVPERTDVVNEVQLWQKLLEEVGSLRRETADSYAKLGNDVSAHVAALQKLGEQLQALPAIQVPPQLASLQDVVRDFRSGAALLHTTSTTLVEAVGTLGIYAPAKTLEELQSLRIGVDVLNASGQRTERSMGELSRIVTGSADTLLAGVSAVGRSVDAVSATISATVVAKVDGLHSPLSQIDAGVREVDSALGTLDERTGAMQSQLANVEAWIRDLKEVPPTSPPADPATELPGHTPSGHVLATRIEGAAARLEAVSASLEAVSPELAAETVKITQGAEVLRSTEREVATQANQLSHLLNKLSSSQGALTTAEKRLATIEQWHNRASHAPLMKFLLLPFRPGRNAQSQNGA